MHFKNVLKIIHYSSVFSFPKIWFYVILRLNLWIEVGLVNKAMGTARVTIFSGCRPLKLPASIMIEFDNISGPTNENIFVPITPVIKT